MKQQRCREALRSRVARKSWPPSPAIPGFLIPIRFYTILTKCWLKRQVELSEIDLFAIATGPGSFTGLRIGIATIKGLAATLDRPTAGVPTLQAVALAAGPSPRSVALLPAGRGEVFAQLLSVTNDGLVTELDQATHISPSRLLEKYSSLESVLWCGEGAIANRALLEDRTSQEGRLAPAVANLATYVASLALTKFRENQLEHPNALQAMYVRPSDAELKV